jgi:hypothetical protein
MNKTNVESVHLWRRAKKLLQRRGLPDALLEVCSRIISKLTMRFCELRRCYVLCQPLSVIPRLPPHRGLSFTVRELQRTEVAILGHIRPIREIEERFDEASRCFVVESRGALAGFLWLHPGAYSDPEVVVLFTPSGTQSVWDFDVYVAPEFRGGLAFYRLWSEVARALQEESVTHSFSMVWTNNDESISSHTRLGAYPIGSIFQLRFGATRVLLYQCSFKISDHRKSLARFLLADDVRLRGRYSRFRRANAG